MNYSRGLKIAALSLCLSGCVVVTIKENHTHIHDNKGTVGSESHNTGSEAADSLNGNTAAPELSVPIP